MKKIYILKETKKVEKVLDDYYQDLLAILKKRNPEAEYLNDDPELYQLNMLLAFIRQGHLKVSRIESYDLEGYLALEVCEN